MALKFSRRLKCCGHPHNKSVSSKKLEAYNIITHSTVITWLHLTNNYKTQTFHASQISLVTSVGQNHQYEATVILWG